VVGRQFIRYVLIGLLAFAVEYGSFYFLFVISGLFLLAANALSFCLGLIVAFVLNRIWAFGSHEYSKKAAHQFGFYATLAVINLLLTLVIVSALKWIGVEPTIGKLIAMVITSSWNFLLLKFWVFTHV
jgi:putative flippase GtrA